MLLQKIMTFEHWNRITDICIIDSLGPKSVLYYKLCSCVKILQFLLKEVTGEHA